MEITNAEQYRRTVEAFAETDRLIAKLEDSPNPDLELIKTYEQHAINLGGMIYRWRRLNGIETRLQLARVCNRVLTISARGV